MSARGRGRDQRRTLVLISPDWPVHAAAVEAGTPASAPAAILAGNRVTACSPPARRLGVAPGQRRRQAQQHCPELAVFAPDPGRDARLFEPVVQSVAEVVAKVRSVHPGVLTVPAAAARYFGSETELAERVITAVTDGAGYEALIGIADGLFAGLLAASRSARVPPGNTPAYLADFNIGELIRPEIPAYSTRDELVSLLRRLGLPTLGAFAALDADAVAARFGSRAALAHRQARGLPDTPFGGDRPPGELAAEAELDPPADRVDMVAFAARSIAEEFLDLVAGRSLICTQVRIEAITSAGEESVRIWRAGASFRAAELVERTRWQLDGWLSSITTGKPPAGPITRLRFEADEVSSAGALQPTIFEDKHENDERVRRAVSRLQGLLGMDTVLAGTSIGGPDAASDTWWTPWQQAGPTPRPGPWPGRLTSPHPAAVVSRSAELIDRYGRLIGATARAELAGVPARLRQEDGERDVVGWSRGWPVRGRWWDRETADPRVRMQVLTADGDAFLLGYRDGAWSIDGRYD